MTLSQTLLGSALGLGARVLEGFKKRQSARDNREEKQFDELLQVELNRRLQEEASSRATDKAALSE